ncbi:MAG: pyridoxal phosphate-dependent decarboxylase family protein, partial [Acidimicrobiia bacterium]
MVYDGGDEVREVARAAAELYLEDNALNTRAFPSLGSLQSDVLKACADLCHGPDAAGAMTAGGTESILMAVKAARERGHIERGVTDPEMVVPASAHAAFHKAASYFGVEAVVVPVDADWRADVDGTADALTPRTVLVVGSAPTYPQGVIDPIPELAELAMHSGASFHTDACMGSFILPFAEQPGRDVPPWDFRVDGVTSISSDVHKLGYAPKGASVILHRTRELRRYQTFVFDDWLGGFYASPSMAGSRPGGPIAAAWAVMHLLGTDGYRSLTGATLDAAARLTHGIRAIPGLAVLGDPQWHIVAFEADDPAVDVFAVGDALAARGWYLDRQTPPDSLHATVSAGNVPTIDDLLADLANAVAEQRGRRADDRSTDYATLD